MSNYKSNLPCIICNSNQADSICYHHLLTRKAYPEFSEAKWNQISTCKVCHLYFHSKPLTEIAGKYSSVRNWLISNGWVYSEFFHKWHPDKNGPA